MMMFYLDEVRVRQILFNLVGNAIKFTDEGSVKIELKVSKLQSEKPSVQLDLSVSDTGCGLDDDQKERIFNVFEQAEGQSTRTYGGTGLGLSITKRLVEVMNGKVWATDNVALGSVFHVRFGEIAYRSSTIKLIHEGNRQNYQGKRILIVDDEEDSIVLLKKYFAMHGIETLSASNGQIALDMLKKDPVDLVFMDIVMPDMNGEEVYRLIKKEDQLRQIPVVACTAASLKYHEDRYSQLFDGFLSKPLSFSLVSGVLDRFLNTGELNNESDRFSVEAIKDKLSRFDELLNKIKLKN